MLFLLCGYSSPLRTSEAESTALEALYNSTDANKWDLDDMWCIFKQNAAFYMKCGICYSNFIGSAWNVTRDGNGYMNDQYNTSYSNTSHLIGLDCECTAASYSVRWLSMTCGNPVERIPAELGTLVSITWLGPFSNTLKGSVPYAVGNLTQLSVLFLNSNNLNGTLPASLYGLKNLNALQVGKSNFEFNTTSPGYFAFVDPSKQLDLCVVDLGNKCLFWCDR